MEVDANQQRRRAPDEEFKRRIKTQTVLSCAETAAMLFWALLAPGQITMRKVDGRQTLADKPSGPIIDLAARSDNLMPLEDNSANLNTIRDGTRWCSPWRSWSRLR